MSKPSESNSIIELALLLQHRLRSPLSVLFAAVEDLVSGERLKKEDLLDARNSVSQLLEINDLLSNLFKFRSLHISEGDIDAIELALNERHILEVVGYYLGVSDKIDKKIEGVKKVVSNDGKVRFYFQGGEKVIEPKTLQSISGVKLESPSELTQLLCEVLDEYFSQLGLEAFFVADSHLIYLDSVVAPSK